MIRRTKKKNLNVPSVVEAMKKLNRVTEKKILKYVIEDRRSLRKAIKEQVL